MSLSPEQIRAYQKSRVERILMTRLGFSIPVRRIPEDDPSGLPTAYCERDRYYMNLLDDDIGTRDVLGVIR